jgi:hypothetical protein
LDPDWAMDQIWIQESQIVLKNEKKKKYFEELFPGLEAFLGSSDVL